MATAEFVYLLVGIKNHCDGDNNADEEDVRTQELVDDVTV